MSYKMNPHALEHALHLMKSGQWALNTVWASNRPTADQIAALQQAGGDAEVQRWHLATDENGAYALPYGDFRRVHRSGVIAAKRAAEQSGDQEIVAAADEILDLFDRMNAC